LVKYIEKMIYKIKKWAAILGTLRLSIAGATIIDMRM
jgi:hypothetical protein